MWGAEVAQLDLGPPASSGEAPKRLMAFQELWLERGEGRTVQFVRSIPAPTFICFDTGMAAGRRRDMIDGQYRVAVGSSATCTAGEALQRIRSVLGTELRALGAVSHSFRLFTGEQ
jgi:hypothetical protein